jgi:class 3 adenylate cyclase
VEEIVFCFRAFDNIIDKFEGIEKIKTIGDAYLYAAGLPTLNVTHVRDLTHATIEIRDFMLALKASRELENKYCFDVRIGVHTGLVVAVWWE